MLTPEARYAQIALEVHNPALEVQRWTRPQKLALMDRHSFVLWIDGNRLGKTRWLTYEGAGRIIGHHPLSRHRPGAGFQALVMGPTLANMNGSGLIPRLWTLLGGDVVSGDPGPWIDPRLAYDRSRGVVGIKDPSISIVAGPAKGATIWLCSYEQGTGRLGGLSTHVVILDEPPPSHIWGEVRARVLDCNGVVRIGFTPTPESPDVQYLRKIIEEDKEEGGKRWGLHNYGLKAENCHVEGDPFPYISQARIDSFAKDLSPKERRQRLEGSWEATLEGVEMDTYSDAENMRVFSVAEVAEAYPEHVVVVSVDHGLAANKQRALVQIFADVNSVRPRKWTVNEYVCEGTSTTADDAESILDMLEDCGISYEDTDVWIGDVDARAKKGQARKSNKALEVELRRALQRRYRNRRNIYGQPVPVPEVKTISEPRKYRASERDGLRLLRNMYGNRDGSGQPYGVVHERCQEYRKACREYNGGSKHPLKDIMDCARYGAEAVCRVERNIANRLTMTTRRA